MSFSQTAKDLREETNLSQKALSQKLGISSATVGHLETGRNEPTAGTIIAYAKFFNISADELLGISDDFGTPTAARMHATTGGESSKLSEKEKALLKAFKKLLPETQDFILRTAQSLSETSGEKSLKKS